VTYDLIKNEGFQGISVRVIQHEGRAMIPLNDIAKGIGYARNNLQALYDRNSDLLKEHAQDIVMITGDQVAPTPHICLNRDGVIGILMKLDFLRIKDPEKKQRVIDFQKWAIETLARIVSGETVPVRCEALEDQIRQHLQIADAMSEFAHVDRGIAATVALARVESETGQDLSWCKALVRKERQQPPGYMTPTQIGQELGGLSARDINRMLQQLGYQYYLGNRWQPTRIGEQFGENIPFTVTNARGGSHSDYRLKWSSLMVQKLRDHINGTAEIQSILPGPGYEMPIIPRETREPSDPTATGVRV
jgi:hypothetical protein